MRTRSLTLVRILIGCSVCGFAGSMWAFADKVTSNGNTDLTVYVSDDQATEDEEEEEQEEDAKVFREAKLVQPQPALEPSAEQAPSPQLPDEAQRFLTVFSADPASAREQLEANRQTLASSVSSDAVLGLESKVLATTDTGNLLGESNSILGITTPRRGPIITDTLARGRRYGQQNGSGSFWFPARQDLDTMLSKIDSRILSDVVTVKGPYTALLGPGLAFYDVNLLPAPRFEGGYFQIDGNTSVDYRTNGEQWYGRQEFTGGRDNFGFRIGHGERTGVDYKDGSGALVPSGYKSKDWDVAIGVDLDEDRSIEFNYLRLDQSRVELPGQIYDIDFLVTDAFNAKYRHAYPGFCDLVEVEGWYNRTRFEGDAQGPGKRAQVPLLNALGLISFTDVAASSAGTSASATWGEVGWDLLTVGADLRYLNQRLRERTTIFSFPPFVPGIPTPDNGIPKSYSANPGLFAEAQIPLTDRLKVKTGGRVDFVNMNSLPTVTGDVELQGIGFNQSFLLYSGYLTAEYTLNDRWTAHGGGGHGMRPPTMTEMYADSPFVAVLPQFVLTSILGNPGLKPERMWQVDLGVRGDYGSVRLGVEGFYSWVDDYITFDRLAGVPVPGAPPTGGTVYNTVNTDLATLAGGEMFCEVDVNDWLTGFGNMSYVEGTDHTTNNSVGPLRALFAPGTIRSNDPNNPALAASQVEALPVIPPLEARLGIRIHDPCPERLWSVEFTARVVDNQDRSALSLLESPTAGYTTLDIRAYAQATDNLLLIAGVENLTDRFYQTHFDVKGIPGAVNAVFQPGVTFYFGGDVTY